MGPPYFRRWTGRRTALFHYLCGNSADMAKTVFVRGRPSVIAPGRSRFVCQDGIWGQRSTADFDQIIQPAAGRRNSRLKDEIKPTLPPAVPDLGLDEFASRDFTASPHNCLSISCALPEIQPGQNHRTAAPQARIKPKAAAMRHFQPNGPTKV